MAIAPGGNTENWVTQRCRPAGSVQEASSGDSGFFMRKQECPHSWKQQKVTWFMSGYEMTSAGASRESPLGLLVDSDACPVQDLLWTCSGTRRRAPVSRGRGGPLCLGIGFLLHPCQTRTMPMTRQPSSPASAACNPEERCLEPFLRAFQILL